MEALSNWFNYVFNNIGYIMEETLNHARITLIVLAAAAVVAILLGIAIQRSAIARPVVLSITGIFLTIPSLAFFALLIPIFGTGNTPAIVALFFYAQLPILRNTVTGLDAVSPAIVEAARGMGMNRRRQLIKVRLPLAWPIIMTGVRVSSLLVVSIAAIAVLVGGDGLGVFIQRGLTRLGLPNSVESVYTGVIFTVLLGLFFDFVFAMVQRFTTPGRRPSLNLLLLKR